MLNYYCLLKKKGCPASPDKSGERGKGFMAEIPISHILFVSTALFFIGMYGLFTRRNMITMLMSVELILNSVNINFVVFNKYLYPDKLDGVFFTIFIITIAAAEAAVAIAIIINLYRSHRSIDVESAEEMKY